LKTLGWFHKTLKLTVEAAVKIYVVDSDTENLLGGDSATVTRWISNRKYVTARVQSERWPLLDYGFARCARLAALPSSSLS
jgi:hypothetical protein